MLCIAKKSDMFTNKVGREERRGLTTYSPSSAELKDEEPAKKTEEKLNRKKN